MSIASLSSPPKFYPHSSSLSEQGHYCGIEWRLPDNLPHPSKSGNARMVKKILGAIMSASTAMCHFDRHEKDFNFFNPSRISLHSAIMLAQSTYRLKDIGQSLRRELLDSSQPRPLQNFKNMAMELEPQGKYM
ncbi:hypothetical protein PAAG_11110 [Paracoccidioides lutzii Pb01]|uniref:Uncharacterized protein n=1 Tax=Paracoccidioides lutzii (strain ATCC MYA-826 / Pb01) TaxID=502779 RepID=A0A0A2V332_PARBA|nr:hypothetical protein PAAG_11110 [Paracoccidioides lutzii Pb01]KGQ02156.1 hypothetical protein PAAG_11110 [Paracoccidioides lutzii Pb01]